MKAKLLIRLSRARIQAAGLLAQSPFHNRQLLSLTLHREHGLTAQKGPSGLN